MQEAGAQNAEETALNQLHPLGNMILFGRVAFPFSIWTVFGLLHQHTRTQMEHRPWTINNLQSLLFVSRVILGALLVVYME